MNGNKTLELLGAPGPKGDLAGPLDGYGQFVGGWQVTSTWFEDGREVKKATGEWHFDWVLGGLGVQDVLFRSDYEDHQRGTTLRCYDAANDIWQVVWMQPSRGEFVRMTGRRSGDRIVQEEIAPAAGRRERWSFTQIRADSFFWVGEVSLDEGATWQVIQTMQAARLA